MKYINTQQSISSIKELESEYGTYTKITADIEGNQLVIGCELHADGEEKLLQNGAQQDNIWGGGINFQTKQIDTTAVLNLRPRLNNNSLEILDNDRREKFITLVTDIFAELWQN